MHDKTIRDPILLTNFKMGRGILKLLRFDYKLLQNRS